MRNRSGNDLPETPIHQSVPLGNAISLPRTSGRTKLSCLLLATFLIGSALPGTALASANDPSEPRQHNAGQLTILQEVQQTALAEELLFQAPDATALTVAGEETLKEHYVEKYMPVEGCSLVEELPITSDIDYVPLKPKPKPKPKPVKKVVKKTVATPVAPKQVTPTAEAEAAPEKEAAVKTETTGDYQSSPIRMTEDERYWLEKLVEAEAAGESYEGKVAVATVIANRVNLPEFPDTVMEVIRAPKQFSPFMDGSIERRVPSDDTLRAVAQVFDQGIRNLPADTGFFCTTEIAPYSWISKNKPLLKVIGNHSFYLK